MFKKYYQYFLKANSGRQHYASHSHHYWPDVTREATLRYWDDSARLVDTKWDYFFSDRIPVVQRQIAKVLNLSKPQNIVFSANTHELVYRLLSCFDPKKKIRVLTTDSEFHSFSRQIQRLSEDNLVEVDQVPTRDFHSFEERFIEEIKTHEYDLIFLSHVFFNSGVVVRNLDEIVRSVKSTQTLIVVDGYHGFMALPTDLSGLEDRIFYIAGSYKYAQGGEGCCFMSVPESCELRPLYTGWFAGFSELTGRQNRINYSDDGLRFAGSTMDFTALYRLHAVLDLFEKEGLTVTKIHSYIQKLQKNFREELIRLNHPILNEKNLLRRDYDLHGHFYTFETQDIRVAQELHQELKNKKIDTDYRGSCLRFGFGLYQEDHIIF